MNFKILFCYVICIFFSGVKNENTGLYGLFDCHDMTNCLVGKSNPTEKINWVAALFVGISVPAIVSIDLFH